MNDYIRGKKILFISPIFHDYHRKIIQALESRGANVDFFPERKYDNLFKIYNHTSRHLLKIYQDNHYKKILRNISSHYQYDYLFVIRGYMIPNVFLERFKERYPKAKLIMYQWDSNETNRFVHLIKYFDRILSFDFKDCDDFTLEYLPLFYTQDIVPYKDKEIAKVYDFFFMGTYLPERYSALINFKEKYDKKYKIKSFIYIPKSSWVKEILKCKKLSSEICHTEPLKRDLYLSILSKTKVMVDVSNKAQSGLAMRIIEALSLKVKVATNNKYILDEPFFNENNICVFNADAPVVNEEFVCSSFQGAAVTLSIEEWVDKIFKELCTV